jgi:hypothetical protein
VTEDEMRKRLEVLRVEHRDLDAAIEALSFADSKDQLQIARLKKRKLFDPGHHRLVRAAFPPHFRTVPNWPGIRTFGQLAASNLPAYRDAG